MALLLFFKILCKKLTRRGFTESGRTWIGMSEKYSLTEERVRIWLWRWMLTTYEECWTGVDNVEWRIHRPYECEEDDVMFSTGNLGERICMIISFIIINEWVDCWVVKFGNHNSCQFAYLWRKGCLLVMQFCHVICWI